jgi:hypothetical protein
MLITVLLILLDLDRPVARPWTQWVQRLPVRLHILTDIRLHTYIILYYTYTCKVLPLQASMASRVGRSIALPFLGRGIRRGWVVNSMPQPHFTPRKDPVPIVKEAGWAPGPVWTAESLAPSGFDPRAVQPVVSRCSDWATWPTYVRCA